MSAFLVSNYHVNALATFAVDQGLTGDPSEAALNLWLENRLSLRDRYEDRADSYWTDLPMLERVFRYEDVTLESLWTVIKAAHCYIYQASEHAGWKTSAASDLAHKIEARACEMLGIGSDRERMARNAHYEEAPWSLEAEA